MKAIVNGIEIFYTKKGSAGALPPVLFLHGNGETHKIFDNAVSELSQARTVYAMDSRSHGQSGKAPLHYNDMAKDAAEFVKTVIKEKPVLVGFSDGGIIGLIVASKHPDLLAKAIVLGANLNPQGTKKSFTFFMKLGYFLSRDEKLALMLNEPNITKDDLSQITVPVVVAAGSKDMVVPKHTEEIASFIKNSTLEILKGETHSSYVKDNKKLVAFLKKHI